MRRLVPVLALLLALLLAMPASAQTPVSSPGATPEVLAGLEYVAARQYAPDPSQPIDRESEGVFILTVRIFQFDSEEHANAGWESTVESTAMPEHPPATTRNQARARPPCRSDGELSTTSPVSG